MLVLVDARKPEASAFVAHLESWLAERVERVRVVRDVVRFGESSARDASPAERPDLVVVLGGDGSILSAVRAYRDQPVPVLGINFGRVGFLASVDLAHWEAALGEALVGRAVVEPRLRLSCAVQRRDGSRGPRAAALNDVVVSRGATQGLLSLSLHDGDAWVTDYRADGLIVATPSGSTAHSLAAGGPLLAPTVQALIVVPICAHTLSHRPIVLSPASALTVRIVRASGLTTLAVDGQEFVGLAEGDRLEIGRAAVDYPLLAPRGLDPYRRIRDRLGWSGDVGAHDTTWDGPRAQAGAEPGTGEVL